MNRTPPRIRAVECAMDVVAQTYDVEIVSTVWFCKEFRKFIRYGKLLFN